MIISTIILIFGNILIGKNKFGSFMIFIFLLISSVSIVSNYFTGKGIDESFLYHLNYGIGGAGFKEEIYIITISLILIVISLIIPILVYKYLPKRNKNNLIVGIYFILIFISFLLHPFTTNILELNGFSIKNYIFISSEAKKSSGKNFIDFYKIPKQQPYSLNSKNIIYIYIESFEKLYTDNKLFPGLTNGLNNLKIESLYFNNIYQAYGTSRSIAGIVGSQCGIPLITSGGGGNSMHGMSSFLKGAYCIGDFLKNAGYDLNYIGGAKSSFAGKGNFYKTHGFSNVEGESELLNKIKNKNYKHDWGLYDDTLFDLAYKKYEILSKKENKFGLFLMTLDTHGRNGVISKKCNKLIYNNKNSILNSYYCTDYLLTHFINKIINNKNYKNTIIVLSSDHYAMNFNNSIDIIKNSKKKRHMLFLIIDPDNKSKNITTTGTTLDIGATTLGYMGFNVNNLGLGVNLLNNNKSINNNILSKWKKNYGSFWNYPSIKMGLIINIKNKYLKLYRNKIEFPMLMYLNNKLETEKILWDDKFNPITLFQNINKNKLSIYIDNCKKIDNSKKGICILYTNINGERIINTVSDNEFISFNTIKKILLN